MNRSKLVGVSFWGAASVTALAALGCMVIFTRLPAWAALLIAWFLGVVVGLGAAGWILRRYPEARYRTAEQVDGMGYLWTPLDLLVPYGIVGVLALVTAILVRGGR
jgi:hypothetical protein